MYLKNITLIHPNKARTSSSLSSVLASYSPKKIAVGLYPPPIPGPGDLKTNQASYFSSSLLRTSSPGECFCNLGK